MEQRQGHQSNMTEFKRFYPPSFEGSIKPLVVEKWLIEMVKAFRVLRCAEEEKVSYATYMLHGDAYDWWLMEEHKHNQDPKPYTWEIFKVAFNEKFFPTSAPLQKEREFIKLEQGNIIVSQYKAEFARLARFAPTLVADEDNKARRFEERLRPRIKTQVMASELTIYRVVVNKVYWSKEGSMRPKLTWKIDRRRSPDQQGHIVVIVQVVRLRDKVTKPILVMHNQVALDVASHMQKRIVTGFLECGLCLYWCWCLCLCFHLCFAGLYM